MAPPNIPSEILLKIFTTLREAERLPGLLPCLTVCREWSAAAQAAIWTHVVVTQHNIKPFLRVFSLYPRFPTQTTSRTQSLTINLEVDHKTPLGALVDPIPFGTNPVADELRTDLDRLSTVLGGHFQSITTFSFTISDRPRCRGPEGPLGFFVCRRTIKAFLTALPPSCINLELNTNAWELGRDDLADFEDHHLCPVIRSLLPRLHHARLRLGSICSEIIHCDDDESDEPIHGSHLRSLCVSLHPPGDYFAEKGFDCSFARRLLVQEGTAPSRYSGPKDRLPHKLVASLAHAISTATRFPSLVRAEITHSQNNKQRDVGEDGFSPDAWELTRPFYATLIAVRDLLADCVTVLPIIDFSAVSGREILVYDRHDVCYIGTRRNVFDKAEDAPWGESAIGARLPLGRSRGGGGAVLSGPGRNLISREEFTATSRYKPRGGGWTKDSPETGIVFKRAIRLEGALTDIRKDMLPDFGDGLP